MARNRRGLLASRDSLPQRTPQRNVPPMRTVPSPKRVPKPKQDLAVNCSSSENDFPISAPVVKPQAVNPVCVSLLFCFFVLIFDFLVPL